MKLEYIIKENFQTVSINGILYSLNTDEKAIYDKIKKEENKKLFKKDLDEFSQRIASGLVTKGILQRRKNPQHEIYFTTRGRRKNAVFNRPLEEVAPPDIASEKWINKNKEKFKEKYGSNYKKYLYGKAWNMYNGSKLKETYALQSILDTYTLMEGTTAYHGSPYDFDEFDVKFIGKGEGHQAHGWGLYFAEDSSVSNNFYRNSQPDAIKSFTLNDKTYAKGTVMYKVLSMVKNYGKKKYAIEKLQQILNEKEWLETHPGYDKKVKDIIKLIRGIKEKDLKANISVAVGQLFTVELPDKKYYFDEDLPFSQQPKSVQKAIKNIYKTDKRFDSNYLKDNSYTGDKIYSYISKILGGDKQASLALYNENVPGIHYGGIRDDSCFVIFNGKDVKIVNKEINVTDDITLPEKEMIADDPITIKNIPNPSEELQMYAVGLKSSVIQYIKNPTDKVIMMALEATPTNIKYIKNPTDEQINFVIEKDPMMAVHIMDRLSNEQILTIIANDNYIFSSFLAKNIERFNIDFFKKCLEKITNLHSIDDNLELPLEFVRLIVDKMYNAKKNDVYAYDNSISQLILHNVDKVDNLPNDLRYKLLYSSPSFIKKFFEIKVEDIDAIINYIKDDKLLSDYIEININPNIASLSNEVINKLIELTKLMKKNQDRQNLSYIEIDTFIKYLNLQQLLKFTDIHIEFAKKILYKLESEKSDLLFTYINELFSRYNEQEILKIFKPYEFASFYTNIIYPDKDKINSKVYEIIVMYLINIIPQLHSRSDTLLILRILGDLTYPQQKKLINSSIEYAKYIKNLDSRLQMKMIEKNPFYIKYINNPTPDVVKLAYEKNPETKEYIR